MEAFSEDVAFFDLVATVSGSNRPEPGHRHTRYAIEVVVPGSNRTWTIQRRYHEFKRLHSALYAISFPGPRLPPRHLWGARTRAMLERRAESLDMWLQGTLAVWKSFYSPGEDEASVTVMSLLTVFLCRDQEFQVAEALAASAESRPHLVQESTDVTARDSSITPTQTVSRQNSMAGAFEQRSSSSSQDANGRFQRFAHKMARSIKSIFAISLSSETQLSTRNEGDVSPKKSQDAPSSWLLRGKMMFRRVRTPRRRKKKKKKTARDYEDRSSMEEKYSPMDDGKPLISPTEEGSVHRVYAAAAETTTTPSATTKKQPSPNRVAFSPEEETNPNGQIAVRRVISMTDDDGSELEWVFDSEEEEEAPLTMLPDHDPLFLGKVIEYVEVDSDSASKKPLERLFHIVLEVPPEGGLDVLRNGFGMVSVPPSPRSREIFRRPWKAYTDKLLYHVQRRLDQPPPTSRSRANSWDGDWIDSGSEEGGSEVGGEEDQGGESVFVQRALWLQDTFRVNGGDEDADSEANDEGYDSEGWASEAANDSYDGGKDQEIYGSWDDGMVWIGPKREEPHGPPLIDVQMPPSAVSSARNSFDEGESDDSSVDGSYGNEEESHDRSYKEEYSSNMDDDEESEGEDHDATDEKSSDYDDEMTDEEDEDCEEDVESSKVLTLQPSGTLIAFQETVS